MKKSLIKKSMSIILVVAMLATMIGSVFAYELTGRYEELAPTEPVTSVNSNILTGATAAANTPVLSILGINVTSSDAPGVLNSGGNIYAPMNLIIFGSEWNENPDPYLQGFYYNLNRAEVTTGGNTAYSMANNGNWVGLYTLINDAKSGPSGGVDNDDTTWVEVDGLQGQECNIIFYYEPDVLLAGSQGAYEVGLEHYWATVNASYNPLIVDGWATNGDKTYCLNDGTVKSTAAMANGVYTEASEIDAYAGTVKKTGRYGDILECGATYSNFALGIYYYAQKMFDEKKLDKITYCTSISYENGIFVVNKGSGRMAQYADNLGDELDAGTYTADELAEQVDVVVTSDANVIAALPSSIKVLDSLPTTVYGTSMQAPDNILGLPYFFAFFYSDQLAAEDCTLAAAGLIPADVTAYFVENIYHVKHGNVQAALDLMMEPCSNVDSTYTLDYNAVITAMIDEGADYYSDFDTDDVRWVDWLVMD